MKNNLLSKLLPKLLALLFIALIVFPADATLKGTVQSKNNESTQDTPGNNLQNQIDQICVNGAKSICNADKSWEHVAGTRQG